MGVDSDLHEIRGIPVGEISEWIGRRFPDETFPQWWMAIFESLEISLSPLRDVAPEWRLRDFTVGAEIVKLAVTTGGVRPSMGVYWLLRLATIARRFEPPIVDLPALIMPDGAMEWALNAMPFSRERALEESVIRKAEYLTAGDEFYAPVGKVFAVNNAEDVKFSALQDVELILSALPWVYPGVLNGNLRREVDAWLEIGRQL
ncbi:hypothetical protein [Umezawaea sp. Da 62-37]|uniref:hypothetical protein n=1 Tax=Umezawaea sp. Da 62-37 TaxID=3075927 RepID=UPI0028F6C574|nr:hypothetical protein [Umezawaea sp. Da 62-37]WNV89006.1 hypothetical protein RM788_12085 [Umezawaea sp. Da 62-37]